MECLARHNLLPEFILASVASEYFEYKLTNERRNIMKDKVHPNYKESTIVCACGETVHTRSTKPSIRVEICSKCHPFFTGKQKMIDSAGRVDKFVKKYAKK